MENPGAKAEYSDERSDQLMTFSNWEGISINLDALIFELQSVETVNEAFLDVWQSNARATPGDLMIGHLAKDDRMCEMVQLFFLKSYKANLQGDMGLYNLSCCHDKHPFLLMLVLHYYDISRTDPTGGFLITDFYKWISVQPEKSLSPMVVAELSEVRNILENRNP